MKTPKVGDKIYVNTSMFLSHGRDDVLGGVATVERIEMELSAGKLVPFVWVKEHPNRGYNWQILGEEQDMLRRKFNDDVARPDPDFHPSCNEA